MADLFKLQIGVDSSAAVASITAVGNAATQMSARVDALAVALGRTLMGLGVTSGVMESAKALQTIGRGSADVAAKTQEASAGMRDVRDAMVGVTASATGVAPEIVKLVTAFASLTLRMPVVIGLLAAATAIGFVWRKLTEDARALREQTKKSIEALDELAKRRAGPIPAIQGHIDNANREVRRNEDRIRELEEESANLPMTMRTDDGMMMPGFVIENERLRIDLLIVEIDAANRALKEKIQAGAAEIREIQARSSREARERQVQTLAELIRGGHATEAERAQAQGIIDSGTRTLAAGRGDSAMRAEVARDVETLKGAFQASPAAQAAQASAALKADGDKMIRAAQDELDLAYERLQTLKEEGLALVYMRHQQEALTRIAQEQRRLEAGDINQQDFDQFKNAALQAAAIKNQAAEINQLADQLDQLWDDVITNLESSMASFFSGARGSFKSMFDDVKKMFIRMWAEVVASRIMKSIIGLFSKDKPASADTAATMQVSAGAVMANAANKQMVAAATMAKAANVQAEAAGTETADASETAAKPGGLLYKVAGYTMTAAAGFQIGNMMGQNFGKVGGAIGGALGGAAAGALIGSQVLPGIGTGVGAIIGGVAGLVGGLFGSSAKAKEAARQMREAQRQWAVALQDFVDAATVMPDHVRREKEINRKTRELMTQGIQASGIKDPNKFLKQLGFDPTKMTGSPEEMAKLIKQMEQAAKLPAFFRPGGKHLNTAIAEMKKLAEAQGLNLAAIEKQWQDQQKTVRDDLAVRELSAKGMDKEAEALRLKLQHEREYKEAEEQGYDAATLAQLRHVQALEQAKQAADGLTTSMLNVPEGFKVAAAAFRSQDPFAPATSGPPILRGWPGPHPTPIYPPLGPIDDGDRRRGRGEDDRDVVLQLDGREVARVTVHHLRRKARQQFGDETRWGEISEA